jgi:crotonobetainyl-CoA:carnitine CoA-transferase CaiB-like acyl-CoA transferase
VQTSTGFNHAEGQAAGVEGPKELPMQILDHATGYLMAFGAMMARLRQAREGGSWHVRVSLAQTGRWLWNLGRLESGLASDDIRREVLEPFVEDSPSGFGKLQAVRHSAMMSVTPPGWLRPAMQLGSHAPAWPSRLR